MQRDRIEKLLVQKKIPITSMRMLVLDVFLSHGKAVSLSDLEHFLPQSDRSTLYRTLKTFEKKGLLHSIQENSTTNYLLCKDQCAENHHHDLHLHFHCTQCGETECIEEVQFGKVKFPDNYQIQELKFVANGLCKNCVSSE